MKIALRLISLVMLVVAVIFVAFALNNPTFGHVFYIGKIRVDVELMRAFYAFYVIVMGGLFVASFLIKSKENQ